MKKAFLILGLVAVSAAAGGATAWTLSAGREPSVEYIEREVERTPAQGTHFTSYEAGQYPDLTYAAENAVKAVLDQGYRTPDLYAGEGTLIGTAEMGRRIAEAL